jgi:Na+(H+)/acetate symporter ActP
MAQWNFLPGHPFNVAILQMMDINVVFHAIGALLCTSAVAAFMSTSDSIVLAASNTFTMDYWTNWIAKYAKKENDQTVSSSAIAAPATFVLDGRVSK